MRNPIKPFLAVLLLVLVAAGAPATQPALSQDALDLGSADGAVRDAAATRLWWAGSDAMNELRATAKSKNPEAAARARTLIQSIDDGITPTTPSDIIDALREYRTATLQRREYLLFQISGRVDGVRVLLQLRAHETDKQSLDRIDSALRDASHQAVALLLSEGKRADAEKLLEMSGRPEDTAGDCAAYWMLRGKLGEKIAALRQSPAWGREPMLCTLEWANGESAKALRDADDYEDPDLGQRMAIQSGDFVALAREVQRPPPPTIYDAPQMYFVPLSPTDALAERAWAAHVNGQDAEADKLLAAMNAQVEKPKAREDDRPTALAVQCICDRPGDAAAALAAAGHYRQAAEIFWAVARYSQALDAATRGDSRQPKDLDLEREEARWRRFLGVAAASTQPGSAGAQADDTGAVAPDDVGVWVARGDRLAARHDWPAAIAAFRRATQMNPIAPTARFLLGWAQTKSGDVREGQANMALAHELPLGDAGARIELYNAAKRLDLKADADRELKLAMATGDFDNSYWLFYMQSDLAQQRGDYLLAARSLRQWVAMQIRWGFVIDPIYAPQLASKIHRFEAMGQFVAHHPDNAMREARLAYADAPGDIDGVIALIRTAAAAGATARADELRKTAQADYARLCQQYPDSTALSADLRRIELAMKSGKSNNE